MNAVAVPNPDRHRLLVAVSVMLATIMQALDTTIANVALPHMMGGLSATQEQIAWVLTSYIVAAAIFMPLTGHLSARYGRRRVFLWSVAGFTVTSMLCGAAQSLGEIVLFRFLQGVFGAALVPLSQAVLLDANPPERHARAMALWGVGVMVGPILGPSLGGWLTEYYNWRWVFYINLPFGILAWLGLAAFVRETPLETERRFDLLGFAFLGVALAALQLLLDRGSTQDWFNSPEIVIEAAVAGLAFYLFLAHMFTFDRPFIEPGLFRDRNFSVGLVCIFVVGVVLFSTMTLLPPYMASLMNYPIVDIGLTLAPRGVGTMLAMVLVGRTAGRIDPRHAIALGLVLVSASMWAMTRFTPEVSAWAIVHTGVVQGFGLGLVFVPLSAITFATLEPRYRGEGTALFSLLRNLGSSIGISIVIAYLAHRSTINHAVFAASVDAFGLPLRHAVDLGAFDPATPAGAATLDGLVTREAASLAYLQDFRLMMWVTLAALPLVLLLKKPASRAAPVAVE